MKLIVIRHAEADHNVAALMVAHGPSRLTPKGRAQVDRVAERLKSEHIDAAFSSNAERAMHTAQGILLFHPKVELQIATELREREMGNMEGKSREEFMADAQASGVKWYQHTPLGGESMLDTEARAKQFIQRIREPYKGQTVLLVSHGGYIRGLLAYLLKHDYEKGPPLRVLNASVTIVELRDNDQHIAQHLNNTDHLDVDTAPIVR